MNCDAGNDDVAILDLLRSLLFVGQDDKTGVQVGRILPISATARQSTWAIVLTGESVECEDHDFSSEDITPSEILRMNLKDMLGKYLFIGGEDGNGWIYVSFHDAIVDCSTGLKHVANLYRIMREEAYMATLGLIACGGQTTPYFVLVECDGLPDHNIGHLVN